MKKLLQVMVSTFMVGFIATLFYTFGLLSWDWYGIGLYSYESNLLLAWILIMFGTSFYYGLLIAILYPDEVKKRLASRKWHHF